MQRQTCRALFVLLSVIASIDSCGFAKFAGRSGSRSNVVTSDSSPQECLTTCREDTEIRIDPSPGLIESSEVTAEIVEPKEQIVLREHRHTVFLTSESFTSNLGGLKGADEKCQNAAKTAGLAGE